MNENFNEKSKNNLTSKKELSYDSELTNIIYNYKNILNYAPTENWKTGNQEN